MIRDEKNDGLGLWLHEAMQRSPTQVQNIYYTEFRNHFVTV